MPTTTGTIIEVSPGRATVVCAGAAGCARCAAGNGCGSGLMERLLGDRLRTVEARVPASLDVAAGDVVSMGIDDDSLVRGAAAAYLVPLSGLLAGCLAGAALLPGSGDAGVLAVGMLGLLAGFAVPRLLGRGGGPVPVVLSRQATPLVTAKP
ncbi:MAG: SoxR reducing system RseC family protein [Pseudomonadota bacterium]